MTDETDETDGLGDDEPSGWQFGGGLGDDDADDADGTPADGSDAEADPDPATDSEADPDPDSEADDDGGASLSGMEGGLGWDPGGGDSVDDEADDGEASDEAVASAVAGVDVDVDASGSEQFVGTDGGRGGAVADVEAGTIPTLEGQPGIESGPGDGGPDGAAGGREPDPPAVSTVAAETAADDVDARFVIACPACGYVAGDDALLPVAVARAVHVAHMGEAHVPRWTRTEGLVTDGAFAATEVRTVDCEDCRTNRWVADRASARAYAEDHEAYTTHEGVEVTTRRVEAPSPEGLLAVVVALTDPPGATPPNVGAAGEDPPGVEATVVVEAFARAALRSFDPDVDRGTFAGRVARAVGWRIRRLCERDRLVRERIPAGEADADADAEGDGADGAVPRFRVRATDRGRETVESTLPAAGFDLLAVGSGDD